MNQAELLRLLASRDQKKKSTQSLFDQRLATNISLIKTQFFSLYQEKEHKVFFNTLLNTLESLFKNRPRELQNQDIDRLNSGNWYQSEQMVGMQMYVDRFNKDINGLKDKLPYFYDLGINFLHLMPITTRPDGENDGGYAVNSYHDIDSKYGTKADFLDFTKKARKNNMFLMLDFVVNHTSDEFEWAQKAKKGDLHYQNYYYTYPDRHIPDEFEKTMPEIFPQSAPGNFTYCPEMEKWVMTCFNSYQWDLNYRNPEVFIEMLSNLVGLANLGVDVIRFDALAFLWKKLGTLSQNLPEAHTLISLFRMCLQVVAPGVILLAEAIVAPRNIIKYFGEGILTGNECEVAYNASLMALLWNSIATKKASLLVKSVSDIPTKPED
ncbi:MAG: alpha-amylase family glycosyl hydrolase, partial [Maribacter dokdonensis]